MKRGIMCDVADVAGMIPATAPVSAYDGPHG